MSAGAMLRALTPASDRIVLTRGRSPRFRDPGTLKDLMPPDGPEACVRQGLGSALAEARRGCGERDAVVVCGSLYLVGDALQELGVEPFAAKDAAPCAG